jgi:hypothetical protein
LLLDGQYVGHNPRYVLSASHDALAKQGSWEAVGEFFRTPWIQTGPDWHSLLAAVADPSTGLLWTFRIQPLSGTLGGLTAALPDDALRTGAGAIAPESDTGFLAIDSPLGTHLIELALVSRRPVPPVASLPARVFFSATGQTVLVAWSGEERALRYVISEGDRWSPVRSLRVDDELGIEGGYEILRQRMSER